MTGRESHPKVGVFHPGTQHSWQTARALQDTHLLAWFATSIFYDRGRFPYNLVERLPAKARRAIQQELRRFAYPPLDASMVKTFGAAEWMMRCAARLRLRRLARFLHSIDNTAFAIPVNRLLRLGAAEIVWGYDTSSLEVFRQAKELGLKCVLDRTIGHPKVYNRLIREIQEEYPEFFLPEDPTLSQRLIDRVDAEHALADHIVVGSEFCQDTLLEGDNQSLSHKTTVLRYCFDQDFFAAAARPRRHNGPVRFLFLGQAGPRKGIHLVLKVFSRIPHELATLTIVGDLQIPKHTFAQYADRVEFYPTVHRAQVKNIMVDHDCFLFPTYFEGAGIVLYEALACGMGIIQSKNAEVVVDEEFGVLLTELSEAQLEAAVWKVIDNPNLLEEWRGRATARSAKFSYAAYRSGVEGVVRNV